jgi:hypothetical protein
MRIIMHRNVVRGMLSVCSRNCSVSSRMTPAPPEDQPRRNTARDNAAESGPRTVFWDRTRIDETKTTNLLIVHFFYSSSLLFCIFCDTFRQALILLKQGVSVWIISFLQIPTFSSFCMQGNSTAASWFPFSYSLILLYICIFFFLLSLYLCIVSFRKFR